MDNVGIVVQTVLGGGHKSSNMMENDVNDHLIEECGWLFDNCS